MNSFSKTNWTTWVGICLGAVVGGAIVYGLLFIVQPGNDLPEETVAIRTDEAESNKTGYIHVERATSDYENFVSAMEELRAFEEELQQDLRSREEELEARHRELQEGAEFWAPERLQREQQEFMQEHQEYQIDLQRIQQRIRRKEAELLEPIENRVSDLVESIARQRGLKRVVRYDERQDIVWVTEELDFTEELAEKLTGESASGENGQ